jgi:hypothetical protein
MKYTCSHRCENKDSSQATVGFRAGQTEFVWNFYSLVRAYLEAVEAVRKYTVQEKASTLLFAVVIFSTLHTLSLVLAQAAYT